MNMKKTLFFTSIIGIFLALVIFFFGRSEFCYNSLSCQNLFDNVIIKVFLFFCFFVFLPLFPFSLLTYRLHDSVFRAWWNFARWFVPIIILITFWLEANDHGGGWGVGSGLGTIFILVPLYAIFILTSLWKIVRAYSITKKKK